MKRSLLRTAFTVFLLALLLLFLFGTLSVSATSRLAPLPVVVLSLALVAWQLGRELLRLGTEGHGFDPRVFLGVPRRIVQAAMARRQPNDVVRRTAAPVFWVAGLVTAIGLFGFAPVVPLFLSAYARFQARESWRFALGLGVAGALVIWLGFLRVLGTRLPAGLFG